MTTINNHMISDSDEKSNPPDFNLRGGAESPSFYTPAHQVRGADTSAAIGKNYQCYYSFIEN